MRAISRRVLRLEKRLRPPAEDEEARRLVELLQTRQRRLPEERGETYEPPPPEDLTGLTFVEVLQMRRDFLAAQRRAEQA
jgi:hypothetical protein